MRHRTSILETIKEMVVGCCNLPDGFDVNDYVFFQGVPTKQRTVKPLPHITLHVFRHTFCTNMANAGMDINALQYVMGHSDVGVTLNVYTHASYDRAAEQMAKIWNFKADAQGKQRKSG